MRRMDYVGPLLLVVLGLAGAGRCATWIGGQGEDRTGRAGRYEATEGTVEKVWLRAEVMLGSPTCYSPSVAYRYTVAGKPYHASTLSYSPSAGFETCDEREAERLLAARYGRPGSPITVYFDPEHPDRAVLDRSVALVEGTHPLTFLGRALYVLAALMPLLSFVLRWRNARKLPWE